MNANILLNVWKWNVTKAKQAANTMANARHSEEYNEALNDYHRHKDNAEKIEAQFLFVE